MPETSPLLERAMKRVELRPFTLEGFHDRRHRKRRKQRITAGAIGIAVFVASIWIITSGGPPEPTGTPGGSGPTDPAEPNPLALEVDSMLDLNTGAITPLPGPIIRSLAASAASQYAVSPDGAFLAYAGTGDDGSVQIFIAGIDGSGIRQVTHDAVRAGWPAWSPDGTRIAYEGGAEGDTTHLRDLFVLEVATGESIRIAEAASIGGGVQFTPDGSALVYTGASGTAPELRTIPVAGGESTLLIALDEGLTDAGNGSLSPDGSLVTFQGGGFPLAGEPTFHCGPCRLVANADGSERRLIPGKGASPAGAWSPDGSRIVDLSCRGVEGFDACSAPYGVIVVDIATGEASGILALGVGAIWLDDHTLLIDV